MDRMLRLFSALALGSLLACTGCGNSSGEDGKAALKLLNVSYDPTRELYRDYNAAFVKHWQQRTGETIKIEGATKAQNRFTLVFERRRGDTTNVRVDWEKDADPSFWLTVANSPACPRRTNSSWPVSAFQSLAVRSREAVASRLPSGLYST